MRRQYILAEFLDHGNAFVRQVLPRRTVAVLRWNAASTATLTVRDDHPIVGNLLSEKGIRCAVWHVTITDGSSLSKRRLLEGRVGKVSAKEAPYGTVTVPVTADFQDLATMLGWQVPGAGLDGQGAAEYARYTGPSETNAKDAIAANAARLGRPWDVVPSLGRGTSAPLEVRMDELADKILQPLINDRLQLTIERTPGSDRWVVDVRAGTVFPRPLTPQSGVIASWEWVDQPATATRAVVGGRGDGPERQFALVVDEALE
ncbi:MAG: hypothetical protein FJW64_15195, partial [Actinobacteria bacterium]|nr:hypothetical protein [Actinomycetota bacterium]